MSRHVDFHVRVFLREKSSPDPILQVFFNPLRITLNFEIGLNELGRLYLHIRAPKTAAYYISPIEIGVF